MSLNQQIEQAAKEFSEAPMNVADKELVKVQTNDFAKIRELCRISYEAGASKVIELLSGGVEVEKVYSDERGNLSHESDLTDHYKKQFQCFIDISALHASQLEVERLRELLVDIAPSWLPENIRLRRNQLLTSKAENES